MDVLYCSFYVFRALLLLIIWLIVSFSSNGHSVPLILSTKKECSYPKIFDCVPCSQDNLVASYFDNRKSLPDPDFSNFINQENCSEDLCQLLIDNTNIFALSSFQRHLIGEGSHRKLVTVIKFYNRPEFTHFVNKYFCETVIVEHLTTGIFSDPFELQHLVRHKVFRAAYVFGDTNLELPSALSNTSLVEIHLSIKSDAHEVVVELPLHARYPPLDRSGYANIKVTKPDLFLHCRPKKDSETDTCFWTSIHSGFSNGSSGGAVMWRVPCGKEAHRKVVTIITYLSALISSVLIVLWSTFICQKHIKTG